MPAWTTASSRTLVALRRIVPLMLRVASSRSSISRLLRAGAAFDRDQRPLQTVGIQPPFPRQVHPSENAGQRRPQLMRDHREKFVLEGVGGLRVGACGAFAREHAPELVAHGAERARELADLRRPRHRNRLLEVPVLDAARRQRQPPDRPRDPLRRKQRQQRADARERDAAADERRLQRLGWRERFVHRDVRVDAGAVKHRHRRERMERPERRDSLPR